MVWSCTAPGTSASKSASVRRLSEPTDAIIRVPRVVHLRIRPVAVPGHRGDGPADARWVTSTSGIVEEVGDAVSTIKPGQFVIGSFFASDNTCEICQAGCQTHCVQRQPAATTGAQSEFVRIPLADGTSVATPDQPDAELSP